MKRSTPLVKEVADSHVQILMELPSPKPAQLIPAQKSNHLVYRPAIVGKSMRAVAKLPAEADETHNWFSTTKKMWDSTWCQYGTLFSEGYSFDKRLMLWCLVNNTK